MHKDYSSYRDYISTVNERKDFFDRFYYHALVDNDLIKLGSILEFGVLSKRKRDESMIHTSSIHSYSDFDSKNGEDFISVSECLYSFNPLFDSFALHTMSSVSLLISKDIEVHLEGARESLFDDERFVYSHIPSTEIKGILVPNHLYNSRLCDIPLMGTNYYSISKIGLSSYFHELESFFGKSPDLNSLKEKRQELLDIINNMENGCNHISWALEKQRENYGLDFFDVYSKMVASLWEDKLKTKYPKVSDVINYFNNGKKGIYVLTDKALILAKKG